MDAYQKHVLTNVFLDKIRYHNAEMEPHKIKPISDTSDKANILGDKLREVPK